MQYLAKRSSCLVIVLGLIEGAWCHVALRERLRTTVALVKEWASATLQHATLAGLLSSVYLDKS
jgi:hypothetical protein